MKIKIIFFCFFTTSKQLKIIDLFLEHRINPALHNTGVLTSPIMTKDGQKYLYSDYTKRFWIIFKLPTVATSCKPTRKTE